MNYTINRIINQIKLKHLLLFILMFYSPPFSFAQWRPVAMSSVSIGTISTNFNRAAIWSGRKLDKYGNDNVYGIPKFIKGIKFNDGTTQTTAGVLLTATQTFTGQNTFTSSVTFSSNFRFSSTNVPQTGAIFNNGLFGICYATVTFTSNGSPVRVIYDGNLECAAAATAGTSFMVDGQLVYATNTGAMICGLVAGYTTYCGFNKTYTPSAGTHSYCLSAMSNVNSATLCFQNSPGLYAQCEFRVEEMR